MCGIAGWVDFEADLMLQSSIVEKMSDKLAFRGPDASGTWVSTHAAFGHRRLAVVDPEGGAQPMVRKKGDHTYVICYNGELYNTLDLRNELEYRGYRFQSNCDTEVLLVSYMEWGSKCVDYLNGIYAFAAWNDSEQSVFLARDRFGVKPLFYSLKGNSLIFASEIKAMLAHPLISSKVDSEGLSEIFVLGPSRTPGHGVFKDISELRPSHSAVFSRKGFRTERYWRLESQPHSDSPAVTIEKVRTLVLDSIERQFVSDVPICTFLSGGLDSSAITALASNYFNKSEFNKPCFNESSFNKSGKNPLHTYSIDYAGNEAYFKPSEFQPDPDAPYVKKMALEFNTLHHYIVIDSNKLADYLTQAVNARDLPGMADIDSSLWLFCREIRKDFKVSLSGECADEYAYSNTTHGCKKTVNTGFFNRFSVCTHLTIYGEVRVNTQPVAK